MPEGARTVEAEVQAHAENGEDGDASAEAVSEKDDASATAVDADDKDRETSAGANDDQASEPAQKTDNQTESTTETPGGEISDRPRTAEDEPAAVEGGEEPNMPVQTLTDALKNKKGDITLAVSVEVPDGALPAGATMEVRAVSTSDMRASVENAIAASKLEKGESDDASQIDTIKAVDIVYRDETGDEVQPAAAVTVKLASPQMADAAAHDGLDAVVVHVPDAEKGEPSVVQTLDEQELEKRGVVLADDEVLFDTDACGVFAIAYMMGETGALGASGILKASAADYSITVTYGDDASIPSDADLDVREIKRADDEYDGYVAQSEDALEWDEGAAAEARLFDIRIVSKDDSSVEYQPAEGATVDVKIQLESAVPSDWNVVHFGETPEVLESETDDDTVSFETTGFSVYAVVSSGSVSNLGGKTFAIINTNLKTPEAVQNETQNNGTRLRATAVTLKDENGKSYVIGENISQWTFTDAGNGAYYIRDAQGQYVNINGRENIGLSANPQAITVANSGNGQVRLSANGYAFNTWDRNVSGGIAGGNWNDECERFTLYEVSQIIPYQATKIGVTDLANKYTQQNPVQDVVVYVRLENAAKDGYDYYAVAKDGSLVQVHDIGDTIGWTSGEAEPSDIEWNLAVHTNASGPNGYFDFQSKGSGQYLIPTPDGILKDDDPSDNRDLGVNLAGWDARGYSSTIERWDDASHAYVGYSYDPATMKLVPYTGQGQELEFHFAQIIRNEPTTPNGLHTVETLDGKSKGITIKMYDFDGQNLTNYRVARSKEMTDVMGWDSQESTNENGVGYANRGLVSETLNDRGFPTATQTHRSLETLFSGHNETEADNLFVKRTYDESGYFTYDSSANYAYLDPSKPGTDKFTLYREVAAPEMEGATTPSGQKGNFFPYDSLEYLAANGSVFTDRTVQYDGDLQPLSPTHPQCGETLYKVPNDGAQDGYASYFFGMTMEADFYQGPDGKDEHGNDTIFEFNGDDDMWLYIDGLLALDIGGCHGAVSGSINFATGEVKVNGAQPYTTNIRALFRNYNNGAGILPNGQPWNEGEAAKFFKGKTFADYTQHSFKMFYMERGAYASNLKVSFNLQTIEASTLVLEKKLPENVQSSYGDSLFAYQIYTIENDREVLYTPPEGRYVTYEGDGARVLPDGQSESAGFKPSYTIDGRTFQNVYLLKPDQAIVLPVIDKSERYYVREIGIDGSVYDRVTVNGSDVEITTEDNVYGEVENLDPTKLAATTLSSVQERGRVTYCNYPKSDHVHNLRLRKIVDSVEDDPDATFRFDVSLESNLSDGLVAYNQGEYYIVKTDADGVDHYYEYQDNTLVESAAGRQVAYEAGTSGSISGIAEGYTILIKGLLAGTDFKVVESLRENEMPAGYMYVKTDVEHADEADAGIEGSLGKIRTYDGEGERNDALVTITNRPTGKIVVEKTWDSGDFVTEHGDVYVALFKETGSGASQALELVAGSARKLAWDEAAQAYRTEYYIPGSISNYVVREVDVVLDGSGNVTSATAKDEGARVTVSGEKTTASGDGAVSDTYIVNYEEGGESTYQLLAGSVSGTGKTGTTRTDVVKNTLPKVSMYKINENAGAGKAYLSGAAFALEDADGHAIVDGSGNAITFTSNADGMLFVDRYFSDGAYYLRETSAPAGYNLLEHRIVLTVGENGITAKLDSGNAVTTVYENQTAGTDDARSKSFRFEVMNNPGRELPLTGGAGVGSFYLMGALFVGFAFVVMLVARRRRPA